VAIGTPVVTSGLAGGYPRGIPIGRIVGISDTQGEWLKSYWLEPRVHPASATHVLVLTDDVGEDVSGVWSTDSLAVVDSAVVGDSAARPRGGPR
jgi:rod shape-determining protein MreC